MKLGGKIFAVLCGPVEQLLEFQFGKGLVFSR